MNNAKSAYLFLFCSIFILLSRKSDGCIRFRRIRACLGAADFQDFQLILNLFSVNLMLVRRHM